MGPAMGLFPSTTYRLEIEYVTFHANTVKTTLQFASSSFRWSPAQYANSKEFEANVLMDTIHDLWTLVSLPGCAVCDRSGGCSIAILISRGASSSKYRNFKVCYSSICSAKPCRRHAIAYLTRPLWKELRHATRNAVQAATTEDRYILAVSETCAHCHRTEQYVKGQCDIQQEYGDKWDAEQLVKKFAKRTFSHCAGCNAAIYCSLACQKKDWKMHRLQCKLDF